MSDRHVSRHVFVDRVGSVECGGAAECVEVLADKTFQAASR